MEMSSRQRAGCPGRAGLLSGLLMVACLPSLTLASGCESGCVEDSRDGHFRITLTPTSQPVPMRKHHDWMLEVQGSDGQTVELDGLSVSGGMPGHGHGLPSQPRVEQYLGDGRYRVSGFLFNMHGEWVLRFQLIKGSVQDVVETGLALEY